MSAANGILRNCVTRSTWDCPVGVDDINKWTPSRKAGGIPGVSTRFSLSVESERDDAERDGRAYLARPNSHARMGAAEISLTFLLHPTIGRIDDLTG